jgi:LCP family protein required for cell wall assembly
MTMPEEEPVKTDKLGFIARRRQKMTKKKELKQAKREKQSRWRRYLRRSSMVLSIVVVAYFGFVFLKAWVSLSGIIDRAGAGSPLLGATVSASELQGEGAGRVNILLLGIGGENHTGGELADTILILSVDPTSNEAVILSVPRDMYVTIPGYGQNKINAAHSFGEQYGFNDPTADADDGPGLMELTLENTLGIPIHYYVRVDFGGYKDIVDAVGGITITLENRVYDPVFNREYGSGALDIGPGVVKLDGQTALLLGRARGSTGGVGLAASDFDRGSHQRLMLMALKDKILTVGTYTDPTNIISLLDALGGHLKTNLQIGELVRLKEIAEVIPTSSIISYGLDTSAENYLTPKNINGQAALVPKDGTFAAIQNFVKSIFVDGFIKSENALVDVLNGTKEVGLATEHANELKTYGYTIGEVDNAPSQAFATTKLYALNSLNPYTQNYLEQRYDLKVEDAAALPEGITTSADFVLILGKDVLVNEEN